MYALELVDVDSGERRVLIEDAPSFGLSPDGQRIVYAANPRMDAASPLQTLEARDVDGGAPATLVAPEQRLNPFGWPRFSADGAQIAFAAADLDEVTANARYVSAGGASAPSANGFPQDVWLLDASGGEARRLAELNEDQPALAWSGDGAHIYVLGVAGLYDVSVQTGAVRRLADGYFHGQLAWAP